MKPKNDPRYCEDCGEDVSGGAYQYNDGLKGEPLLLREVCLPCFDIWDNKIDISDPDGESKPQPDTDRGMFIRLLDEMGDIIAETLVDPWPASSPIVFDIPQGQTPVIAVTLELEDGVRVPLDYGGYLVAASHQLKVEPFTYKVKPSINARDVSPIPTTPTKPFKPRKVGDIWAGKDGKLFFWTGTKAVEIIEGEEDR